MSASPSLEQSHNDSEGLADSNGLQYRFSGMVFMTKLLLLNTGYGNADGKLGIAMDPNAPFFVNSALLTGLTLLFLAASHALGADRLAGSGPNGRLCRAALIQGAPPSRL